MLVVGGLSIWDDLEGVTERLARLPGPVAVLNNCMDEKWGKKHADRLQHRQFDTEAE
jgi:hypothetical protein